MFLLTILTGKNLGFAEFITKIYSNTGLAASDVFDMFTQLIKSFNFIMVQMSEKRDSSNRQ